MILPLTICSKIVPIPKILQHKQIISARFFFLLQQMKFLATNTQRQQKQLCDYHNKRLYHQDHIEAFSNPIFFFFKKKYKADFVFIQEISGTGISNCIKLEISHQKKIRSVFDTRSTKLTKVEKPSGFLVLAISRY